MKSRSLLLVALGAALLLWSCGGNNGSEQHIEPLPRPDLSLLDTAANFPLKQREHLEKLSNEGSDHERAEAFGRLGMLYHAYKMYQPAMVCYSNARFLNPQDSRWLYLLGHIHVLLGENEKARSALSDVIRLTPENASALVVLGELELVENKLERAEELFGTAVRLEGDLTAAYIGLGNVASARKDYPRAVDMFSRALAREPDASVVHYMLAMAYRSMGDQEKAKKEMELRGDGLPALVDPLLAEVEMLRNDADAMRQRGSQAASDGRFAEALQYYTEALRGNPNDPRVWINVGLCHQEMGHPAEAMQAYSKVIEYAGIPALSAEAHLRLGDLLEKNGQEDGQHYKAAVELVPDNLAAVFRYAESLRSKAQFEEALPWYEKAIKSRPDHSAARLGRALVLIRLKRWQEVVSTLQRDIKAVPDQAAFPHLLARVLAAAPDDEARDGQQALSLTQILSRQIQGDEIMATLAMALAETGHFEEAVSLQQKVVNLAIQEQRPVSFYQGLLKNYTGKKPCRTPWADDDPLFLRKNY